MKKHRLIPILISLTLFFSNIPGFAAELKIKEKLPSDQLSVYDMGHGEFKITDVEENSLQINGSIKNKSIKLKKVKDDIYEISDIDMSSKDKERNKLLKVNENTFLKVKEIKIDLRQANTVNDVLDEYNVNPLMAKEIKELSEKALLPNSNIKEVTIYTPKQSKKLDVQTEAVSIATASDPRLDYTTFYTGYNGIRYMDEVYYIDGDSGFRQVKAGSGVRAAMLETFEKVGTMIIKDGLSSMTGGYYKLVDLFGQAVYAYPANTSDYWQVELHEDKYRKFTSLEAWDSAMQEYYWTTFASVSQEYYWFTHHLKRGGYNIPDLSDERALVSTPSWYSADMRAYNAYYYGTGPYNENFYYWSPDNGWTQFHSV